MHLGETKPPGSLGDGGAGEQDGLTGITGVLSAEWHPRMLLGQDGQGDVVPMRSPSAGRCLLERLWNKINIMHLLAVYRGPRDSAPVDFLHRHILLGKQDAQASGVMAGRKGWW